jgi:hypothetical protein
MVDHLMREVEGLIECEKADGRVHDLDGISEILTVHVEVISADRIVEHPEKECRKLLYETCWL